MMVANLTLNPSPRRRGEPDLPLRHTVHLCPPLLGEGGRQAGRGPATFQSKG
jgi:hypothetical protein